MDRGDSSDELNSAEWIYKAMDNLWRENKKKKKQNKKKIMDIRDTNDDDDRKNTGLIYKDDMVVEREKKRKENRDKKKKKKKMWLNRGRLGRTGNKFDASSFHEILSRLPVKSIMRFQCVCKYWCSLIQQNTSFLRLHFHRSQTRPHLLALLPDRKRWFYTVDLFDKQDTEIELHAINCGTIICPSINGLICFVDSAQPAARIYNLSTRQVTPWIKTELSSMLNVDEKEEADGIYVRRYPTYVLGFDPETNAHKVICVWLLSKFQHCPDDDLRFISKDIVCEVLTVGDNSWRRINDVPPYEAFELAGSVYVNGSIYWCRIQYCSQTTPASECAMIIAFDVGSEKFRKIPTPKFISDVFPPPHFGKCFDGLLDVGGRLALFHEMSDSTIVLWMFHDDKKQNSTSTTDDNSNTNWVEQTISIPSPHHRATLYFVGFLYGQIIIRSGPVPPKILLSYDLTKKITTVVQINDEVYSIIKHCPLVLITPTIDSLWPIPQKQQVQPQHNQTQSPLEI